MIAWGAGARGPLLVLREVHGLSHREIAARLGISENLSGVRLCRARRRLRAVL